MYQEKKKTLREIIKRPHKVFSVFKNTTVALYLSYSVISEAYDAYAMPMMVMMIVEKVNSMIVMMKYLSLIV